MIEPCARGTTDASCAQCDCTSLINEEKRVDVVVVGRTQIIAPASEAWDSWFDGEEATSDFMSKRDQPAVQEREAR